MDTTELTNYLNSLRDLQLAVLYGSRAVGAERPGSDVDLAVLFERELTADHKLDLISGVAARSGCPVDLVDLRNCHGTLLGEIVEKGLVLVERSEGLFFQLTLRRFREAADVKPYVMRSLRERVEAFSHGL